MSIKKLAVDNCGPFVSFDNSESLFSQGKCVVHGFNGSGKSHLCDLLFQVALLREDTSNGETSESIVQYAISRKSKESLTDEVKVQIDRCTISIDLGLKKVNVNGDVPHIHVFNETYLSASIGDQINLAEKPILIGQRNVQRDEFERELRKQKSDLRSVSKAIDERINKTRESLGSKYRSQKRTKEAISRENYLSIVTPVLAHPNAQRKLDGLTDPPEQVVLAVQLNQVEAKFVLQNLVEIDKILAEPYFKPELTMQLYQKLMQANKSFYNKGVELFRETESICPFCLTELNPTDKSTSELLSYIESEYSYAESLLTNLRESLTKLSEDIVRFIITSNNENPEIRRKILALGLEGDLKDNELVNDQFKALLKIVEAKLSDMPNCPLNETDKFTEMFEVVKGRILRNYRKKVIVAEQVNDAIAGISSRRRALAGMMIENSMYELWEDSGLRCRYVELNSQISNTEQNLTQLEESISNDRTVEIFNTIVSYLGIRKYELNTDSKLVLKLDTGHDISDEGFRISAGERKLLGFSYFIAEVLASVRTRSELADVTIIVDDPVDSSDYNRFYSFVSLVEKIDTLLQNMYGVEDICLGQIIIFTHNALLFDRLVQSNSYIPYVLKIRNHHTEIKSINQRSGLTTLDGYITQVCEVITSMKPPNNSDYGHTLRRILEIIASIENITSNSIKEITGESKLSAIVNHHSHESLERILDPLPETHEYIDASIELIELIRRRIPYLYKTIESLYLNNKKIDEYRVEYAQMFI